MQERNIGSVASHTHPDRGTEPTTQACALTRNQTSNPLLCRMMPNQLELHWSEWRHFLKEEEIQRSHECWPK